ncbi:hypothetical protein [Nitrosospira sp. Nsp18]|uniref:hypothetical protein n=1 Tax=Nitrosospira sp. Nsp18 TaxID=1855334 RepID=UPI00115FEF10|nr:hypothetical protein [Nitrosospira sp. Nsp18]
MSAVGRAMPDDRRNDVGQSPTYSIHMTFNAMVMPFQSTVVFMDGERALLFARLRPLTLR